MAPSGVNLANLANLWSDFNLAPYR
jgi:hypothetical protein